MFRHKEQRVNIDHQIHREESRRARDFKQQVSNKRADNGHVRHNSVLGRNQLQSFIHVRQ